MNTDTVKLTADIIFTLAVQSLSADEQIPSGQARQALIKSGTYDALYAKETGLWKQGPDYLLDFHHKLQRKT